MGSHMATCHLSGLLISEGEETIAIPMKYGNLTTGNTLTYLTNNSCEPLWLGITGNYSGFKYLNKKNESITDKYFLDFVNKSFFNNHDRKKEFSSQQFFILSDGDSKEKLRYRYYDDVDINNRMKKKENLPKLRPFESIEQLLEVISGEHLLKLERSINRIGFILIKKSIYDDLIKG